MTEAISRRALLGGALAATAFHTPVARAQTTASWPEQPVRMIIPYPAGGSTDVLFRILGERLKDKLGQSFVIENKPGASGNIGIDAVAKATPDGLHDWRRDRRTLSINQFLIAKMPFDAEKDLVAPSLAYELPNVAVVLVTACAGEDARRVRGVGQEPAGRDLRSAVPAPAPHRTCRACCFGPHRRQRRACAVPRRSRKPSRRCCRATSPSRSTTWRPTSRNIQSGADARARRHLRRPLADAAGRADHERGWNQRTSW